MAQEKIDYAQCINLIKSGMIATINENIEYYGDYKIIIADEQEFLKKNKKNELERNQEIDNTIFIIVKFGRASITYAQTVLPVSLMVLSEANGLNVCRDLLNDFVFNENLEYSPDGEIRQIYEAPVDQSNYNQVLSEYRSIFSVEGSFLISKTANNFEVEYKYIENGEEKTYNVELIQTLLDLACDVDPQVFYNSNNFTRSKGVRGTITINITAYFTDNPLMNRILDIMVQKKSLAPTVNVNEDFELTLTFKNGKTLTDVFKLVDASMQQVLKEIPNITMTFTN